MTAYNTLEYSRQRFQIFKFLGFSPVTIVKWKSFTKPIDVLCFVIPVFIGFSACYFAIIHREKLETSKSKIADLGNFVMVIASICVSMVSVVVFFIFRHNLWSVILKMDEVERKFKSIGFTVDYTSIVKANTVKGACITSVIYPLTAFLFYMDRSILKTSLTFYAGFYFIMCVGSITAYVAGVFYRLQSLNEVLKLKSGVTIFKNTKTSDNDFGKLMEIYSILMNSCDDISLIFGVPMMLGIGIVFFFSIFSNFTAYMDIAGEGKLSPLTISSVVFALYYGGFVVVVVFVCSRVTSEVS
jgi:hypothetical protein